MIVEILIGAFAAGAIAGVVQRMVSIAFERG